jgi:hypothetical protein
METAETPKMSDKISKNLAGVAGEYYVCDRVMSSEYPRPNHAETNPLFDMVAADPLGKKTVSIQVDKYEVTMDI